MITKQDRIILNVNPLHIVGTLISWVINMQVGAIIPLKILSNSKSRLRKEHSTAEFNELVDTLSEKMFYLVLSAVFFSERVSEVLIATSDSRISEVLSHLGINFYLDHWIDLNLIVKDGISILRGLGCEIGLVLMADLPHISNRPIDQLMELDILTGQANCFVILRSSDQGTTGLVQKPLGITPLFLNYANSAEKHFNYALERNIPCVVIDTKEFSIDIDTVVDLSEFVVQTENDNLTAIVHQLRKLLDSIR